MPLAGINFNFKKFSPYLIVWVIFLLAFSLRLQGNIFGLPYFFHPDETKLTTLAWRMAEEGEANPGNFFYPTGFIYLLLLGFKLLSFLGLTFHQYQADLVILHWLGRFYSALLGAGSVWLIYELGKKVYSASSGVAASLFLGLNFIHLRHSHYATTDITSLFFILLSLFFALTPRLLWAALLGGIATGIKYSAWPIIFPLVFASFRDKSLTGFISKKKFISAIFFYLLGFFLATPFALVDLRHFMPGLAEIMVIPNSRWLGLTHSNFFYYFYDFRPLANVGIIIFILSLMGLVSCLKKWSRSDTILASFFLPYIILASLSIEKIDRFFLPAIIIFILWAAISLEKIALILSRLRGNPYLILSILVIGISIHPLIKVIRYDQALEEKDTRLRAAGWIGTNIPSKSHIALFSHPWANPPLERGGYNITSIPLVYKNKDRDREIFKLGLARRRVIKELSPAVFQNRINRLTPLEDFTLRPLPYFKERGVDYIIISGFFKDDLLDKATARYFPKLSLSSQAFFKELEEKTERVYFLSGVKGFGKDFALSPDIEIYKLKKERADEKRFKPEDKK